MPTEVMELELTALPDVVRVATRYDAVFTLMRWRGYPVGKAILPVKGGIVPNDRLRDAIVQHAAAGVAARRLRELLDISDAGDVPMPSMSVAVCTRDRPDDLARCLTALQSVLWEPAQEIVVVDSCSTRDTTREVAARFPRVRYVRASRPGLDIARNLALMESRADVVAFTDDDAMPDAGWLRALARQFTSPRTLCATGLTMPAELETDAQIVFETTNGFGRGFAPKLFDGVIHNPFDVAKAGAGVNMALRRTVLTLVGAFDEALDAGTLTRSGGDHDMFTRILSSGYCIAYEPAAIVWHRHRREMKELVDTVRGYGSGVYAHLTRHILRGETLPVAVSLGWLRWQLYALLHAPLGESGRVTRELGLAELRGCLEGPIAYLRSRWRVTRERARTRTDSR